MQKINERIISWGKKRKKEAEIIGLYRGKDQENRLFKNDKNYSDQRPTLPESRLSHLGTFNPGR